MRKPKQPNRKQPQQQRKPNDLSHCLAPFDGDHTLIAVVELSLSSWLVAGLVPGVLGQRAARKNAGYVSYYISKACGIYGNID